MTTKTEKLMQQAGIDAVKSQAIAALCDFAGQRSGIDWRNYGNDDNGRRAYRQECRDIAADFRRFTGALMLAGAEGVTDADVIAEAPHAFSGRLEWRTVDAINKQDGLPGHWVYCTGQYFPTEYRKAARVLLESATRRVRQARPPQARTVATIAELKALNRENGGCWFEPAEMRFFGTRIETGILRGRYFITFEQPPHGARKYSVRSFDDKGKVDTVGKFCEISTLTAAREIVKGLPA